MSKQRAFYLSEAEIKQANQPKKVSRKRGSGTRSSSRKVYDCELCGLYKKCKSPLMQRFGNGKKKILIVGQCPGRVEDREDRPMIGPTGRLADKMLGYIGIDMDDDCTRQNIVQCHPGVDKKGKDIDPTKNQIKCCRERIKKDIEETKPKLIICLGASAINGVLQTEYLKGFTALQMHGKVVPYHKYNCWVGCSYHPAYFGYRKRKKDTYPDDELILGYDLANIISYLDEPLPQPLTEEGNKCITDVEEVVKHIESFCDTDKPTAYDYEATSYYPWDTVLQGKSELLTISVTDTVDSGIFIPLKLNYDNGNPIFTLQEQEVILDAWRKFLRSSTPKVVQNVNMEEIWNRMYLNQPATNIIHDTMIAAHVINNNSNTTGLGFQAFMLTGHEYKGMIDPAKIMAEPLEKVCNYNSWDSRYTLMSYFHQKRFFEANPRLVEFYKFYHEGALELVSLRETGNRIDMDVLQELEDKYIIEKENVVSEMRSLSGVKQYEKESGNTFNPDSTAKHLQKILYGIYEVKKTRALTTPSGLGCTDKTAIQTILDETKNNEVKTLLTDLSRFRKTCSLTERITNYKNVMDKNFYVHPSYNLNIADTYRSSSNDPNIQNVFKRDEELQVFRKCICPSIGRILPEVDHSGMEVKGIAMASGDPELIRQIKEGKKWELAHPEGGHNPWDTHYMWSAKIYGKSVDEITKIERYNGKNGFVFARFYGATDKSVARCPYFKNVPTEHMIEVAKDFWEQYHYVKEWQNKMIHDYLTDGYVEALNGWRRIGPLTINQIYNNLIQGVSFHILLDDLIRIQKEFRKRKLKSVISTEVHDSLMFDAVIEELDELIDLVTEIMCANHFEWQRGIPLGVDWEIGKNWYEMHSLETSTLGKFVTVDKNKLKLKEYLATV